MVSRAATGLQEGEGRVRSPAGGIPEPSDQGCVQVNVRRRGEAAWAEGLRKQMQSSEK